MGVSANLENHFNNHWYQDVQWRWPSLVFAGQTSEYRIDAAEPVYDETGTPGGFLYGVRRVKTRLLTKPSALTVDG